MNILIVNDDGPGAFGITILKETVKSLYKDAKIVVITPEKAMTGEGMAITPSRAIDEKPLDQHAPDEYIMRDAKPADLIYRAFLHQDEFLTGGRDWDVVLSGVNHGHNVGMDILHSGTCGMAMLASSFFGCCAMAFSQAMEPTTPSEVSKDDAHHFENTIKLLRQYLMMTSFGPGECTNINFPTTGSVVKGWKQVKAAHYSRWREVPLSRVPRAKGEVSDITELALGYVTTTDLHLSYNSGLRY